MLGFRFLKTQPTEYVLLYKKGKIKKEGIGLSFFYYTPSASVVIVPAITQDTPFIFKETTLDFQEVDIQGQVTYGILDRVKLATLLDFSVNEYGEFTGDGAEKLTIRLTNLVQVTLREKLKSLTLRESIKSASDLVDHAREKLKEADTVKSLGLEVIDISILKISPTPEIARALEASARENLLKEADEAVYERRNFAVEQERRIQENELQTKISIEEKNRMIREEKMNAEIAVQQKQNEIDDMKLNSKIDLELKRQKLVEYHSQNIIKESEARAISIKQELESVTSLKPELLDVLAANQMNTQQIISQALKDIAKNANKIGNLNISPDLLNALMEK